MSARRELLEETGFAAKDLLFFGRDASRYRENQYRYLDFLATIEAQLEAKPEDSEVIASIVPTERELCNGIRMGFLLLKIKGIETKVFLRDPFLTYALVQMGIRRLFSFEPSK